MKSFTAVKPRINDNGIAFVTLLQGTMRRIMLPEEKLAIKIDLIDSDLSSTSDEAA